MIWLALWQATLATPSGLLHHWERMLERQREAAHKVSWPAHIGSTVSIGVGGLGEKEVCGCTSWVLAGMVVLGLRLEWLWLDTSSTGDCSIEEQQGKLQCGRGEWAMEWPMEQMTRGSKAKIINRFLPPLAFCHGALSHYRCENFPLFYNFFPLKTGVQGGGHDHKMPNMLL